MADLAVQYLPTLGTRKKVRNVSMKICNKEHHDDRRASMKSQQPLITVSREVNSNPLWKHTLLLHLQWSRNIKEERTQAFLSHLALSQLSFKEVCINHLLYSIFSTMKWKESNQLNFLFFFFFFFAWNSVCIYWSSITFFRQEKILHFLKFICVIKSKLIGRQTSFQNEYFLKTIISICRKASMIPVSTSGA